MNYIFLTIYFLKDIKTTSNYLIIFLCNNHLYVSNYLNHKSVLQLNLKNQFQKLRHLNIISLNRIESYDYYGYLIIFYLKYRDLIPK